MESKKTPRSVAILAIYILVFVLILLLVLYLIPVLKTQFSNLAVNLPKLITTLETYSSEFQESRLFSKVESLEVIENLRNVDYTALLNKIIGAISNNAFSFVGSVFNVFIVIFTVPIFLFYIVKDGEKLSRGTVNLFPKPFRSKAASLFQEIDQTLSADISGLLTVGFLVGFLAYIGYRIIGIDYALLLAVIAGITEIIPYLGPVLGTIPGIILGLTYSPLVALEVLLMMIVIQQIASRVISPVVIGKKLNLHPIIIMSLLLIAGNLGGIIGMIFAVPLFAVIKITLSHLSAWRKESQNLKNAN